MAGQNGVARLTKRFFQAAVDVHQRPRYYTESLVWQLTTPEQEMLDVLHDKGLVWISGGKCTILDQVRVTCFPIGGDTNPEFTIPVNGSTRTFPYNRIIRLDTLEVEEGEVVRPANLVLADQLANRPREAYVPNLSLDTPLEPKEAGDKPTRTRAPRTSPSKSAAPMGPKTIAQPKPPPQTAGSMPPPPPVERSVTSPLPRRSLATPPPAAKAAPAPTAKSAPKPMAPLQTPKHIEAELATPLFMMHRAFVRSKGRPVSIFEKQVEYEEGYPRFRISGHLAKLVSYGFLNKVGIPGEGYYAPGPQLAAALLRSPKSGDTVHPLESSCPEIKLTVGMVFNPAELCKQHFAAR